MMETQIIAIETIVVEDRAREDLGDIEQLVESIRTHGLIQPLAVCKIDEGYRLIAGGRRYEACRLAGFRDIPVNIFRGLDPLQLKSLELAENIYRKDLTWQEEVKLKKQIHNLQIEMYGEKKTKKPDDPGWSQTKTANMLGETQANISRDLTLADMIDIVPELTSCESKSEAMKLINRISKAGQAEEIATAITKKRAETPLEIQRKKLIDSYIIGNFFDMVKKLPSESIDFIECDPPYGLNLSEVTDSDSPITQTYNEIPDESYDKFIYTTMVELARVMRQNTWGVIWFDICKYDLICKAIAAAELQQCFIPIIWTKPAGATNAPRYRLASTYESAFYFYKGAPMINKQGRINAFRYTSSYTANRYHLVERPVELIQDVISTFIQPTPDKLILCPFLGCGSTILAAANLGCKCIGYDISQDVKNFFIIRANSGKPGEYSSYEQGDSMNLVKDKEKS